MLKRFTYLLLFLLISHLSFSQNDYRYGNFSIRNFSANDYKGVAQNWDISQNSDNFIIVANNNGVLHFDGNNWLKIKLSNKEKAQSIGRNDLGEIFIGGNNEYGKLQYNERGEVAYKSLLNGSDSLNFGVIWNTIPTFNQINFISNYSIFSYNYETEITTEIKVPNNLKINKSIKFNDNLICYLHTDTLKYCAVFDGVSFARIKNSIDFEPKIFFEINNIKYVINRKGEIREIIYKNGNYKLDNLGKKLIAPQKLDINCVAINKKLIAVGTDGDGIFLFNKKGGFIRSLNADNGLINLQIRKLYFDHNDNLWSCNDNGLSLIDLSNPITKFDDNNGITFTTEHLFFSDQHNYLATHSDLFNIEIKDNKKYFTSSGVFDMEVFQIKNFTFSDGVTKTLVIANDGIYDYSNEQKTLIGQIWAWDLSQSSTNQDRIWIGLDGDGVGSLIYSNGNLSIENESITGTSGEVRRVIEFESKIYYAVKNEGIVILDTTKNQKENIIRGLSNYNSKDDNIQYQQFTLEIFDNKLFVGTDNGLYTVENGLLTPFSDEFNLQNLKIHRIFNENDEKLWLSIIRNNDQDNEKSEIGYIDFTLKDPKLISSPFVTASNELIQTINKDMDGIIWFAGIKGIYLYNPNTKLKYDETYQTHITSVQILDSTILNYSKYAVGVSDKIEYKLHTVTINYCTPSYFGAISNSYSYLLEGLDNNWSKWSTDTKATFPRLQEGDYTFRVKSKNYYGIESEEAIYNFTILPPWYRTIWAYLFYLAITVVFVYIIIKLSIRRVKEQNEKLEKIVEERTAKVEQQKNVIEEKNRDIVDSIKYAKRIQNTILPTNDRLDSILENYFVIYEPKDIVSGDFYWADFFDGKTYISAIDCTGHGVPGAFVSIVGFNGLKRTVNEFKLREPGKILDKLTELVVETFSSNDAHLKDGMDMSLCSIDYKSLTLEFAGANNPLILIRNGELIETKGNKQPIGDFEHRVPFTNHKIQLEKGDNIYLFTDGYADQFGGPKGKKFKLKTLKSLLLEISNSPIDKQKELLNKAFNNWKGDIEQLDDVCLIGIKI